jgi:hypothetical protein
MRHYKIKPDKFGEYVRLGTEKYEEVMMPHGKLVGYWAASLGAVSEVHHLWEYGERQCFSLSVHGVLTITSS